MTSAFSARKMPKIYEYLGILFLIYTDDHLPVHVHAQYGDFENKIELYFANGELVDIVFQRVRGKQELPAAQRRQAEQVVREYHLGIVEKWSEVMVLGRKPAFERINRKG